MIRRIRALVARLRAARGTSLDMEIPDWPCPSRAPHKHHFWSDGTTGFECDGRPA